MIKRVFIRLRILILSLRFRLRHSIWRGTVRSDVLSMKNSKFGRGFVCLGSIAAYRSHLEFGENCAVSKSAEIGVENGGKIQVGNAVKFGPRTIVSTSDAEIAIGNRTTFFSDCLVTGSVSIGSDCLFANNVTVLSGTHQIYGDGTIRENDAKYLKDKNNEQLQSIVIADDCWLGANVVILAGVNLAKGVVVGANSVVTKSFPEYSILGGVPAAIIGSRLAKNEPVE